MHATARADRKELFVIKVPYAEADWKGGIATSIYRVVLFLHIIYGRQLYCEESQGVSGKVHLYTSVYDDVSMPNRARHVCGVDNNR